MNSFKKNYSKDLSHPSILCWSEGWLTPDKDKQTALTAEWLEPAFERASAITFFKVSFAVASAEHE